jgi:hypothetical protein
MVIATMFIQCREAERKLWLEREGVFPLGKLRYDES